MKEVTAVVEAAAAAPAAAAPTVLLNSVQAVVQTQQSAGFVFNPERFTEISGSFWQVLTVADQASQNSKSLDSNSKARARDLKLFTE